MKYIKIIICVIYITFLTSCSKSNDKEINNIEVVRDNEVISLLKDYSLNLLKVNNTINVLKNNDISLYTNDDKIIYGIELNRNTEMNSIDINTIERNINTIFIRYDNNYKDINGCPSYIYTNNRYIINNRCNIKSMLIGYYDKIYKEDNYMYLYMYIGLIDIKDNSVYGDVSKTNYIDEYSNFKSYGINDSNKKEFDLYKFEYRINGNKLYLLNSIKKNK